MEHNNQDTPPARRRRPGRSCRMGAGVLAICLLASALVGGCTSRQEVIARMQKNFAAANYRAALLDLRNLVQKEPDNAEFRLKLAQSLLRTGDLGGAEPEFARAAKLGAASAAVLPGLTEVLIGEHRYQDALDGLNKGRSATAEDATLLKLRGQALLGLGNAPGAQEAWLEAAGKDPKDPAAHLGLAETLAILGDLAGARAELDKALELGPESLEVHLARGRWFSVQREPPAARDEFAKALELAQRAGRRTDIVTALAALAEAEAQVPDLASAQQHLQQLQKLAPTAGVTLLLQARIAVQTDHLDEAQTALKQLLSRDPRSEPANLLLGIVAARSGKPEAAETYLEAALSQQPDNLTVRKLLAEAQLAGHQPEQALQTATDPRGGNDPALLSIAGRASLLEGNVAGSVDYFERSEQAAPADTSRPLQVAEAYLAAHRTADALALLQKLEVPDALADRREWLLFGALIAAGRTAEIRAEAQRFAQARPTDVHALLIAAGGLQVTQDMDGARALLGQATIVDPRASQPWSQLGWLEWSQHDYRASETAFARALTLDPKSKSGLYGAAQDDLAQGHLAAAIQKIELVRAEAPRAVAPRIELARLYLSSGDVEKSTAVYTEAHALAADNPDLRHLGALLALAGGNGAEATASLENLVKQFPKSARLQSDLARAYLLAGRVADAHAAADAALRLDPAYWPALLTTIATSLAQKDVRGADAALERLRHTSAPAATVQSVTADFAARDGKLDEALKDYIAVNSSAPSGALAIKMYAMRLALHSTDPAAPLRDWLQRSPSDFRVRVALAQQLQHDGQSGAAAQEYETVLKQAPQQPMALNNLAWIKLESGDAKGGLELARRARASNGNLPAITDTYGWALVQSGQAVDAVPLLREACGKMPGNYEARYHLGVALIRSGAVHEGREELQAVVTNGGQTPVGERARALLASLDGGGKG